MFKKLLFLLHLAYLAALFDYAASHGPVPLSWPFVVDLTCSANSLCGDVHISPYHNSQDQFVLLWQNNGSIQAASFTAVVNSVPIFVPTGSALTGRPLGAIALSNDTFVMFYRVADQTNLTWYWDFVTTPTGGQYVDFQPDVLQEEGLIAPLPNSEFVLFWAHDHTFGGGEGKYMHVYENGTSTTYYEWAILPNDTSRLVDIALAFAENEGTWVTVVVGNDASDPCEGCRLFFVVRDQFDNVLSNFSYFVGTNISNIDSVLLPNSTLVVVATVNNVSIWAGIFDLNGTLVLGQQVSSSLSGVISGMPAVSVVGSDEGFVIVWYALEHDGTYTPADGWGVYGRLFTNNGAPVGNEFRINGWPHQGPWPNHKPALGVTFIGDFYVFWLDSDVGIFGRRFSHHICPLVPLNQVLCDSGLGCDPLTCQCDVGFQSNATTFSCEPICSNSSYSLGTYCFSGGGIGCNGMCQCSVGYQEAVPPQANCISAPNQDQALPLGAAFSVTNTSDNTTMRGTPTLVTLNDDNIAVIWIEGLEIHGQILDSYGRPIGSTFYVVTYNESTHVGIYLPVAAAMSNAFAVAWIEDDGTANHTHVRLFFNSGEPLTDEIDVDNNYTSNNAYTMAPSLAVYNNDSFVVVWGSGGSVWFRAFSRYATPLSATQQALAGLSGVLLCSYAASASILPNSQMLVLLLEVTSSNSSSQPQIWWQLFSTSWSEVARGFHDQGSHPAVTAFQISGNDYFAVAYWSPVPHSLAVSFYAGNSTLIYNVSNPVYYPSDANFDVYTTRIDHFPSGAFVVLFTSYDTQTPQIPNQPQGKLIRSNFTVVLNSSQPFSVNSTGLLSYFPGNALAIVSNNQFFVAWGQQDNQIYLQAMTGFNAPSVSPTPPPPTPLPTPVTPVNNPVPSTPSNVPALSPAQSPVMPPQQPPIFIPLARVPVTPTFIIFGGATRLTQQVIIYIAVSFFITQLYKIWLNQL